jgi:hypothetical protein
MTNLTHEFYHVSEDFIKKFFHKEILRVNVKNCSRPLEIHDDIIQFIFRTLRWIKVKNYTNKEEQNGLYYHGISIIYPDQIKILYNVIVNWKCLFGYAPEIFHHDEYAEDITMQREQVIEELNKLIDFLSEIIKNGDYLIHSGI